MPQIELKFRGDKDVLIIGGPTASGKSQLAIDLALKYNGVVINADSQQLYKMIPILSACPSEQDKKIVPHWGYEVLEPWEKSSVVDWLDFTIVKIKKAWEEKRLPIVVGGTGMYIDNLVNGVTPIPETRAEIRKKVLDILNEKGVNGLHEMLAEVDPKSAEILSHNDTTRVRRAYEVFLDTAKPLSQWHKMPMIKKLEEANFAVIKILPSQAELDERCYLRFDKMIEAGALQEAGKIKELRLDPKLPAMRALGLPELIDYLDGKISLDEAVELAKLHSRQYAKRQRTWFGNKLKADVVIDKIYMTNI